MGLGQGDQVIGPSKDHRQAGGFHPLFLKRATCTTRRYTPGPVPSFCPIVHERFPGAIGLFQAVAGADEAGLPEPAAVTSG